MCVYQNALNAQSACNLSGVVYQFARDMDAICDEVHAAGGGTDEKNHHPVCRLYAEQIAYLTGAGTCDTDSYSKAYRACRDKAEREVIDDVGMAIEAIAEHQGELIGGFAGDGDA